MTLYLTLQTHCFEISIEINSESGAPASSPFSSSFFLSIFRATAAGRSAPPAAETRWAGRSALPAAMKFEDPEEHFMAEGAENCLESRLKQQVQKAA